VAVVQCTYTHTQYREQHKTNNTENNTKIRKSAGRAPSLRVLPWYLPYNWGKSTEKPQAGQTEMPNTHGQFRPAQYY